MKDIWTKKFKTPEEAIGELESILQFAEARNKKIGDACLFFSENEWKVDVTLEEK